MMASNEGCLSVRGHHLLTLFRSLARTGGRLDAASLQSCFHAVGSPLGPA